MTLLLTPEEIHEVTGLVRPQAQAKALERMGFTVKRSPCGRVLVSRSHFEQVLGGVTNNTGKRERPMLNLRAI